MRRRQKERLLKAVVSLFSWLGMLTVAVGGVLTIFGTALPWANAVFFESLHVSLPGLVFVLGSIAAAAGVGSLFLIRHPVLCMICGVIVITTTAMAAQQIPHAVRGELIAVKRGFFPINELLDKFDIEMVQVANYGAKDSDYLGEGLQKTALGGILIIIGSLIASPKDPWLKAGAKRFIYERCATCNAKWPAAREAVFCPKCAAPTLRAFGLCRQCTKTMQPPDRYCIHCGYPRSE